jgi:carbon-monoxide dehydrogenase small subunit
MTAKTVTLTVNGKAVTSAVEPRSHLADFLREQLLLTGTHLGCEHGVCGACTVEIDGQIARACITFAVACDGAEVRTIEGFDDDPVMARLRQAFTQEHALQCGYCTPGMLIAARDIATRLPEADEACVRVELSGNLCRCTGYAGIVAAVRRVLEERQAAGEGGPPTPASAVVRKPAAPASRATPAPMPVSPEPAQDAGMTTLEQSFVVRHPRARVWAMFKDVERVASCMPGAALTEPPRDGQLKGRIAIKLGPMGATFAGEATLALDEAAYQGIIAGSGRDQRSATRAKGRVAYRVIELEGGAATRVEVEVAFSLAGPLAQFSRAGIVTDLAGRLTAAFAENLQAQLDAEANGQAEPAPAEAKLDAVGLAVFGALGAHQGLVRPLLIPPAPSPAQVGFLDMRIVEQFLAAAGERYLARLQQIATVAELERGIGVLLDHQHGHALGADLGALLIQVLISILPLFRFVRIVVVLVRVILIRPRGRVPMSA